MRRPNCRKGTKHEEEVNWNKGVNHSTRKNCTNRPTEPASLASAQNNTRTAAHHYTRLSKQANRDKRPNRTKTARAMTRLVQEILIASTRRRSGLVRPAAKQGEYATYIYVHILNVEAHAHGTTSPWQAIAERPRMLDGHVQPCGMLQWPCCAVFASTTIASSAVATPSSVVPTSPSVGCTLFHTSYGSSRRHSRIAGYSRIAGCQVLHLDYF